ncbi:MAG: CHC2 zinc finger domain-containing protein [Pseudomonadota bacterium]
MQDDGRLLEAKSRSMQSIVDQLDIPGLRKVGRELIGPCPACGGKKRFNVNVTRGVFLCRSCGAKGDGLALVQHARACDFKSALDFLVGDAAPMSAAEKARRKARIDADAARRADEAARYRARAIGDAARIWSRAKGQPLGMVEEYLVHRGIRLPGIPKSIRFLPDHPYVRKFEGRGLVTLHRGPCMISAIQDRDGSLVAVHQTWIDLANTSGKADIVDTVTGEVLPAKMVRGSKSNGAIRLGGEKSGVMIVGEGIETTLSARVMAPLGPAVYWAGLDLYHLSGRMMPVPGKRHSGEPDLEDAGGFLPPPWVRRLVLIQDGDSDPSMTRARLLSCARRAAHTVPGLSAAIVHPGAGVDLNDLLNAGRAPDAPDE